jgi:hypothetical protein
MRKLYQKNKVKSIDESREKRKKYYKSYKEKLKLQTYPYKPFTHVRKPLPKDIAEEIKIMKAIIQKTAS